MAERFGRELSGESMSVRERVRGLCAWGLLCLMMTIIISRYEDV